MTNAPVQLDHNATTPIHPEVADAMWPYLTQRCGNPSSDSAEGREARDAVETARAQLADLIGAHPDEVVFTSGGTESNNLAIRGVVVASRERWAGERPGKTHLVTSRVEHPATSAPVAHLEAEGASVRRLPVDGDGRVDAADIATLPKLATGDVLVGTLILAQNETGTIQPVRAFAECIHAAGGVVHTDAAQAVGKIPVSVEDLGVDLLSVAGHKLYAPKAVGALYVRRGTPIAPLVRGAGQERGLRPGTENVASIVGLGVAAGLAASALDAGESTRQRDLRERLWRRLDAGAGTRTGTTGQFVRLSPTDGSLPNTLMVSVPGELGRDVLARCSDVVASTGSACHAGVDTPAETLLAMGLPADVALGAIRLSLGRNTSAADVDRAANALLRAVSG